MSAYIFICNELTEQECYKRQLFGTNNARYFQLYFSQINVGDDLFLYNYELGKLRGPFKALTKCGNHIVPGAWGAAFPFQVRVQDFSFQQGLFSNELGTIINYTTNPPARIDDTTKQKIIEALKRRNNGTQPLNEVKDETLSNYWIFKCDVTTGGRVFNDNIMGTPSTLFKDFVNKVQIGDTIFVWQIEERKLYGIWKALERGRFDETAFPETNGRINAVFKCARSYTLKNGLDESKLRELQVYFGSNQMPYYKINLREGRKIQEALFSSNEEATIQPEKRSVIPGEFLTEDGHWVRSQGETLIDNWLYHNNLIHSYEYRIQRGAIFKKCDFFLPQYNLVIEYWGLSGNPSYEQAKRKKIDFYNENKIDLIELFPKDIYMLSEVLKSKLAAKGINIE